MIRAILDFLKLCLPAILVAREAIKVERSLVKLWMERTKETAEPGSVVVVPKPSTMLHELHSRGGYYFPMGAVKATREYQARVHAVFATQFKRFYATPFHLRPQREQEAMG